MGAGEILLIFVLVVLLFGAKRLPELARSMGRSIKEFKHATQGLRDELDMDKIDDPPKRTTNAQTQNSEEGQKSAKPEN